MPKKGKRYVVAANKLDKKKTYSPEEAINLIKDSKVEKFDASIEIHLKLGIDPKKTDQQVRGTITLPHGTGKTKKVAAFVSPDKEKTAREAGAEIVGGDDLIAEIKKTEKVDFEVAVATPDMMPKLAQIAKILGTRGVMPSPKNETISPTPEKIIGELKKGKIVFKADDTCNIHQIIGKTSFETTKLLENLNVFLDAIKKAKPSSSKGTYIKNAIVCSTMGPGIKIGI